MAYNISNKKIFIRYDENVLANLKLANVDSHFQPPVFPSLDVMLEVGRFCSVII